jgi:hypothetical protein
MRAVREAEMILVEQRGVGLQPGQVVFLRHHQLQNFRVVLRHEHADRLGREVAHRIAEKHAAPGHPV